MTEIDRDSTQREEGLGERERERGAGKSSGHSLLGEPEEAAAARTSIRSSWTAAIRWPVEWTLWTAELSVLCQMDGWMDRWLDGWLKQRMDTWTAAYRDGQIDR